MEKLEAMREARELISNIEHWTQNCYARDINNKSCDPNDPQAVKWCAAGALKKACLHHGRGGYSEGHWDILWGCIHELAIATIYDNKLTDGYIVHIVNDTKSHEDVMKLYDSVIESLTNASSV